MNYPEIMNVVYRLRLYKTQKSWSNAALSSDLESFGGTWPESYVAALFVGNTKPDEEKKHFFDLYLLDRYSKETLS